MILSEYKLFSMLSPKSQVAEAFRTLRTNIQFFNVGGVVKRILFTSAGPREGKSSTIANLATMMVQAGKRVLIIDADLRNPTQHKILGQANFEGLTTSLVDETLPILTYIQQTEQEGLDILTSGPIPPNPAELLGSKRMKQLLNEVIEVYDIVLIDSPPTIAVTDPSVLAQAVDGVVLVLASGEVSRDYALQAKEQLEQVGAKILGIVLNKVEMKSKEYYYYYSYDQGRKKKRK
jgi:capsular exopolysaccharide synthesis family protein